MTNLLNKKENCTVLRVIKDGNLGQEFLIITHDKEKKNDNHIITQFFYSHITTMFQNGRQ